MPETPDENELENSVSETKEISEALPGSVLLEGESATFDRVADELRTTNWVHFACHALTDAAAPSNSRLLLHDHRKNPLDVRKLTRLRLTAADFAFLSACQTAVPTPDLADEAIHIASAFQLAGFRNVIGTLWPIFDDIAGETSEKFYSYLASGAINPSEIAVGLNQAVRAIRHRFPTLPSHWASHVHIGP
jgi:CHAT domain-containing protein